MANDQIITSEEIAENVYAQLAHEKQVLADCVEVLIKSDTTDEECLSLCEIRLNCHKKIEFLSHLLQVRN